ncbi:MAG TPA: SMC family ATPase, partial [Acidimicrobiales bacterium]|nr:SMC family ATPase [Acidimicrobiales bacterium]
MLLTRLYLRNYRVFEDELDLPLPPGLVGIYGPNGAGKSTLLEAIVFTLWGRARTANADVRSSGVGGECVTEVEFEHEGHLYLVRRRLTGVNATPRAEAACDGLQMSEGVRDTARYLHSVLGMDDAAFRASVFAEQKQLAAFSSQAPDARRKLVLQLLGVTPLDAARDAARKDARTTRERHDHLRGVLPDVDALAVDADDADAAAAALTVSATDATTAADRAERAAADAADAVARLDVVRAEHDALVVEGRAARAAAERAATDVAARTRELSDLDAAAADLADAERRAEGLAGDEAVVGPLRTLADATAAAEAVVVPDPPPPADPAARDAAADAAGAARSHLAQVEGQHRAVVAELDRARAAASRSGELSGEADCPLCGQALGDAFAQVRAHRAAEVAAAEGRLAALDAERAAARTAAAAALTALEAAAAALAGAEAAAAEWARLQARAADARAAADTARAALAAVAPDLVAAGGAAVPGTPARALAALVDEVGGRLAERRRAASAAERRRGR